MIFTRFARTRQTASSFALAIALVGGTAVGFAALEAPAHAQKDKKAKPAKADYSKSFIEAYKPLETLAQAEAPDMAAIKAGIPTLAAAVQTADDRNAAGSYIYTMGTKLDDRALALQGMEMMIQSGKLTPEQIGQYNFVAGQLAYGLDQFPRARAYFQAAVDAGYTENDPQIFVAESYFAEDKAAEGLAYLSGLIDARRSAGQQVDEEWIKRGLAMAYNNQLKAEANKYSRWFVTDYPGEQSWGDAVAILLNTGGYENPEILDLLRLGRRAGVMRDAPLYLEYIEAADYRRLPAEVVAVIDEGYASGKLDKTDPYVIDTRKQAAERAAADRADIESLMRDAQKPGAPFNTVIAGGDALLSLGRAADAETVYAKALESAGANRALVLTRLGIAQVDQGKLAEAQATFAKIDGPREPIAQLWAIYAKQKADGAI